MIMSQDKTETAGGICVSIGKEDDNNNENDDDDDDDDDGGGGEDGGPSIKKELESSQTKMVNGGNHSNVDDYDDGNEERVEGGIASMMSMSEKKGGGLTSAINTAADSASTVNNNVNGINNNNNKTGNNNNNNKQQSLLLANTTTGSSNPNYYGDYKLVKSSGNFPALGSTLGPYFCLGRLGKGTFCSIHKCINLNYFHNNNNNNQNTKNSRRGNSTNEKIIEEEGRKDTKRRHQQQEQQQRKNPSSCRLAAAKVEVGEFRNSGVLGGEATMLEFLDHALPKNTVPIYMGHYRGGGGGDKSSNAVTTTSTSANDVSNNSDISAIVMEYLPGQDMHIIRDWATKNVTRRISVQDAVYLTATKMLPLLQRMHQVGIVHRDVKPSNCVKSGLKDFLMVDFGLSKSIVVPKDSTMSDHDHPWKGVDWIRSPTHSSSGDGYYRKERPSAEFRGTSMYASVRVHQLKDYCPRDDMWSLLYVFCDLVSGGLPWMSHAANRDRESCRKLKERVHGEEEGRQDETERLLMGHEYHVALFKKFKGGIDPPEGVQEDDGTLPEPLPMSKDPRMVGLMRQAFNHLAGLSFSDIPDYDLLRRSIEGFLDDVSSTSSSNHLSVEPIDWQKLEDAMNAKRHRSKQPLLGHNVPNWNFVGGDDDIVDVQINSDLFAEAEMSAIGEAAPPEINNLTGQAADLARLPLELQFRIAQMEYNTIHHDTITPDLALRDWMNVALPILFGEWDSNKFERGGHRSNDDGYRREFYLKIIEMCKKCSATFNNFNQPECTYYDIAADVSTGSGSSSSEREKKRRKILSTIPEPSVGSLGTELIAISQAAFGLRAAQKEEEKKPRAPPPRLMFGSF